ncbi:MAG TPA: response regulator transcription factor [Anaerolineae bacterium]|nr:response regulator transcription factor [Anaerolineae bacterium]
MSNAPIRVLIADDHAMLRDALTHMLSVHADIAVVGGAGDGREAVELVRQLQPDVAIVDISMPELNGIDAIPEMAAVSPQTRVVILSMQGTSEHLYRSLQAGAHGYLLKGSAGKMLIEAVRAVHAGHRYFSEEMTQVLVDDFVQQRERGPLASPLERLSARERQILQMVVEGKSSAEIADILALSPKTVETYRSRLMTKLGIKDLPGLVKFAVQHGLTPLN